MFDTSMNTCRRRVARVWCRALSNFKRARTSPEGKLNKHTCEELTVRVESVSEKRVRFCVPDEYYTHISRTDYPIGLVWWTSKDVRRCRRLVALEIALTRILKHKLSFIRKAV